MILFIAILTTNNVFGQSPTDNSTRGEEQTKNISTSIDKYLYDVGIDDKLVIAPKHIADDFTSFTIRVKMSTNGALLSTDKIFKEFGKIRFDQDSDGNYIYLVGTFKKESLAYEYLLKIVSPRYPSASVVQYENGQMVK